MESYKVSISTETSLTHKGEEIMATERRFTDSIQKTFCPTDYGFRWTEDLNGRWYEYKGKEAEKAALRARNRVAKQLRAEGWTVKKWSMGRQLVSKGGIGSGRPHIELVVPVYALNAWK